VVRRALSACIAATLLLPAASQARALQAQRSGAITSAQRRASARRAALSKLGARDPAALATTLAERYWGATPCGGLVAVQADQPLAAGMDAATDGWVTFESSLGPNDLQAPASTYTQCTISLARWQWSTPTEQAGDWNMFCLTVVHELGHLLGHPHSLSPGSVMAAVFSDEASVPPICREARVRVEASAGLTTGD
jgi:hypothetical protein